MIQREEAEKHVMLSLDDARGLGIKSDFEQFGGEMSQIFGSEQVAGFKNAVKMPIRITCLCFFVFFPFFPPPKRKDPFFSIGISPNNCC
jgi:hypothetical protein